MVTNSRTPVVFKNLQTFNGIVFKNLQEDGVKSEAELKESRERLGAKIGK